MNTTDTTTLTIEDMWDTLKDMGVEEQTLQIITAINGYSEETMCDVLFAHTGYRYFEQLENED